MLITLSDATEAYTNKGGNPNKAFRSIMAPAINHYNNREKMPRNQSQQLLTGVTIADVIVFAVIIAMIKQG